MMLRKIKDENADFLVERAIRQGLGEQAEFIHFELKEHHLLIRLRWGSQMRMLWRGPRADGLKVMAYMKNASGMSNSVRCAPQIGEMVFVEEGQSLRLPAVCKPYLSEEKVILSLLALSRDIAPTSATGPNPIPMGDGVSDEGEVS